MASLVDPPSCIIRQYLIDQTIGVDPTSSAADWPVFIGTMPDDGGVKDKAIAVFDTAPILDGSTPRTGEGFYHFGIQVIVRADSYPNGWTKLKAVMDTLETAQQISITYDATDYILAGVRITSFFALGTEPDKRRRESFSANLLVAIR